MNLEESTWFCAHIYELELLALLYDIRMHIFHSHFKTLDLGSLSTANFQPLIISNVVNILRAFVTGNPETVFYWLLDYHLVLGVDEDLFWTFVGLSFS